MDFKTNCFNCIKNSHCERIHPEWIVASSIGNEPKYLPGPNCKRYTNVIRIRAEVPLVFYFWVKFLKPAS